MARTAASEQGTRTAGPPPAASPRSGPSRSRAAISPSPEVGPSTTRWTARVRAQKWCRSAARPITGTPRAARIRAVCSPVMQSSATTTAGWVGFIDRAVTGSAPADLVLEGDGLLRANEIEDMIDGRDVRVDVGRAAGPGQPLEGLFH